MSGRDRNQLLCVLAVQSARIDAADLAAQLFALLDAPEQEFASRLAETGLLSDDNLRRVAGAADALLDALEGDAALALDIIDPAGRIRAVLSGDAAGLACRNIEGTTLREAIRRARTASERLTLLPHVIDVCRAVGLAHGRGIIHRGINSGVILISDFGECVVRDWSLSKARRKEDTQARDLAAAVEASRAGNATALDPAFLSPELALEHMESVDARSDVYALGAVLYELLAGQSPFPSGSPAEVLAAVTSRKPEPISEVEPTAPTELINICERAMHQEPSARYASAKHLAEEIERSIMALPRTHAEAPPSRQSAAGEAKYRVALAFTVALLVLVGGVAAVSQRRVVQERDKALVALRDEQQKSASLKEERDKATQELEDARTARHEAETERDKADVARQAAVDGLHQMEERVKKAEAAATPPPPPAAPVSETASSGAAPSETPPAPGAPTVAPPANLPAKFLGPLAGAAKTDAGQRPPGVTKAEFAQLLPQLTGALKMDKGQDGKPAVMLGAANGDLPGGLKDIGFEGGDIITNINRASIENVDQAKKSFEGVKNDSGFAVRIVRGAQSSWMRVNVYEKMPEMPGLTPPAARRPEPPKHPEAEPPADAPPPAEKPADQPPPPAEAAPSDQDSSKEPAENAEPPTQQR